MLIYSFPFWYYYVWLNAAFIVSSVIWSYSPYPLRWFIRAAGALIFQNAFSVWIYYCVLYILNRFLFFAAYAYQTSVNLGAGIYMPMQYYFLDSEIGLWVGISLIYLSYNHHFTLKVQEKICIHYRHLR